MANRNFAVLRASNRIVELAATLEELEKGVGHTDDLEEVTAIRTSIQSYHEAFKSVAAAVEEKGLDENSGLQGIARDAAHEVEVVAAEFAVEALQTQMLQLRRREKDFLLRGDDKYVKQHREDIETFKKYLEESSLTDEQKSFLRTKIGEYGDSFAAAAKSGTKGSGIGAEYGKSMAEAAAVARAERETGKPENAGRPENAGKPENAGRPENAGKPENAGGGRPEGAGRGKP